MPRNWSASSVTLFSIRSSASNAISSMLMVRPLSLGDIANPPMSLSSPPSNDPAAASHLNMAGVDRDALRTRSAGSIPAGGLLATAGAGGLLLTQVPIGSPAMARSMFPSFLKLNTRIGKLVFQAHADGRHVHDLELVAHDLVVGEVLVEDGVRVFLGVGRIDAVDAGGLEQDLGAQLLAAQGRRGVGRDERAARARWPG